MSHRSILPAAIVDFGGCHKISVYGHTDVLGIPTVEINGGGMDCYLRPVDADRLAAALTLAARIARGEKVPTALDELLAKGKS